MFYCSLFSFPGKHGILSLVINMMDVDKKLIGKRIRHRREVAGFSQEQLAEKLELSTNHISSMECGKSLLTTKRLLNLCDILGGTPNYYLLGEIEPEADGITALIQKLSPSEQETLCRLLVAYLHG
jgi:transcriptional regulator with XRE-family HTH domain